MARVLRDQMMLRQSALQSEKTYNQHFQAFQEADASMYEKEEKLKVKNHRKQTSEAMKIVQQQAPMQKLMRQADLV